ncbi:MAG: hypothetical protein ABI896_01570 [Actinomycetota bacterium]
MDIGLRPLGLAARADRAHDLSLAHRRSDPDPDRSQVDEGDGVAVLSPDREAQALARQSTSEGDDPGRRSDHVGSGGRTDVDSPVLAARIRIALGDERPEHRSLDRPRPRGRA